MVRDEGNTSMSALTAITNAGKGTLRSATARARTSAPAPLPHPCLPLLPYPGAGPTERATGRLGHPD